MMNELVIISGIIVLVMALDGYRIGLIRSVFALVKLIVSVIAAAIVTYCVATFVPPALKYIIPGIFISVIVLVFLIVGLIVKVLNLVDSIPVVRQINRLAGLVSGAVYGVVCVWILFIVITYFSDTTLGSSFFEMIPENEILKFLYDVNPFNVIFT